MKCAWGCGREATLFLLSSWHPSCCEDHEADSVACAVAVEQWQAPLVARGAPPLDHAQRVNGLRYGPPDASEWTIFGEVDAFGRGQ